MSSDEIDMAFYCNHMALHMVRANDEFEIYGGVVMNAEVIAYKKELKDIIKLGIGQKREHLHKIDKENYKEIKEILEISPVSLPYALGIGEIDGAVLDITKAVLLPEFKFISLSDEDYISYSLVVRKDIIGTKIFDEFLIVYNQVVDELNQASVLQKKIDMPEEFWHKVKVKFLSL